MTSEAAREARPAIDTPGGRFEFVPHNCFACGTLNAGGLGLALHVEPGRSWTELALDRRFEGWEGVVHGGILCTILDEVMAWALVGEDNWGVTARMTVDFRRPVDVGAPIRAEGWITRSRRRIVDTAGPDRRSGDRHRARDRDGRLRRRRDRPKARPPGPLRVPACRSGIGPDSDDERADERPPIVMTAPTQSEVTARAVAFVAERRDPAEALGRSLAELSNDPDAFATALSAGLADLADPDYLAGQQRIAPGIGAVHGVRWPLLAAVQRGFRNATRGDRPTPLLFLADRLFRERELEARWFAFGLLERTLAAETERTWQLLRRAAREAGDWITVDSLAHPYAKGIVAEPYRWAELEQLVYSPSRWERRLVGSTIATMTHVDRRRGRDPDVAVHALSLLGQLMGDAEPDVQKALSWAYRSLTVVDAAATEAALRDETERAVRTGDGHRAWVIRDTLAKLDPASARRAPATVSPGSASTPAPRPPRPPPTRSPASAGYPTLASIPSPRCDAARRLAARQPAALGPGARRA